MLVCTPASATDLDDARARHRAGDFDAALRLYDDVAVSTAPDAERAVARNNACAIRTDQGRFETANAQCREALAMRRALGDWRGMARTLNNLARVLQATGNIAEARQAHEQALEINLQRDDTAAQVINRINLAVLETEARRYTKALGQLAATEPLLEQVDPDWARGQRALLLINRAVVQERLGAFRDALASIDLAIADATAAAPHLLADAHLNRGVVLRNLGDAAAALEAYRSAGMTFADRGNTVAALNATLNEAIVQWRDLGDNLGAERSLKRVLDAETSASADDLRQAHYLNARIALARGDEPAASRSGQLLAQRSALDPLALEVQARLAHAEGRLDDAINSARRAISSVEKDRASVDEARYRQSLLTDKRASYALAIDLLFERHSNTALAADLTTALRLAARGKALGLIDTLADDGPDWVADADTRYIETFFSGKRLHVWALDSKNQSWRTLSAPKVRRAARQLSRAAASNASLPADAVAILADVIGAPGVRHLVLSPDRELVAVPFDLVYADRTRAPAIRHVAAVTLDRPKPTPAPDARPTLLAVSGDTLPTGIGQYPALQGLRRLVSVTQEVGKVQAYFESRTSWLAGADASEGAFLAHAGADVQHIASHAVFDSRLNNGAVLILAQDSENDGLLFPEDIASLQRPARLTVLSACSTARGSTSAGAPVNHLAGAFLAAGSRAVVAALWEVDDAVTAVVMEQFYARLAEGMLPHEALHATKNHLAAHRGWHHPSIWAPWVIYGPSDQQIFAREPQGVAGLPIALLAAAAALFLLGLWRKSAAGRVINS